MRSNVFAEHLFHDVGLHRPSFSAAEAEAWMQGVVARVHRGCCGMRGHDLLLRFEPRRLSLRCADCGWESPIVSGPDPEDVIVAARRLVEHVLAEHPLDVSAQLDSPIRLDARLTATALAHLLENAAQYSPVSSPIHVIVRQTQGEFVIQVRDHGPGIPPSDLPHLFQRFYRGAAARRLRPGTGLGLWITERLLAVQDGRVWAENCPDGGARFTIAVPTNVQQFEACV